MSHLTEKQQEALLAVSYHLKNAATEANSALSEVKAIKTDDDFLLLSDLIEQVAKNLGYAANIANAEQEPDEETRTVLKGLTTQLQELDSLQKRYATLRVNAVSGGES